MNVQPQSNRNQVFFTLIAAFCGIWSAAAEIQVVRSPHVLEFEQLVGKRLEHGVKVDWQAPAPAQSNLVIYSVQKSQFDEKQFRALAQAVQIKGEPKPLPANIRGAPGYWIKETNPTNQFKWKSLSFSQAIGDIVYSSGDDGYRWDLKRKKPLISGVPNEKEAFEKALALLPVFGLTTNDLELRKNGGIKVSYGDTGVTYTDRTDMQRKRIVMQRHVTFFQRVPGGATMGVGEGGQLRISFISEGKLSGIEFLFRKLSPVGTAKPKSKDDLIAALQAGDVYTWQQSVPRSIKATDCFVVYPQGNSDMKQPYLWPFYAVTGSWVSDEETKSGTIYIPVEL